MRVLHNVRVFLPDDLRQKTLGRIVERLGGTIVNEPSQATTVVVTTKKNAATMFGGPPLVHAKWLLECWKHQRCVPTDKWSLSGMFVKAATKFGWTCHHNGKFTKGNTQTTKHIDVARDIHKCAQGAATILQRAIRGHQARQNQPTLLVAITGVAGLAPFHTHPRATVALMLTYLRVFHKAPQHARMLHKGTPVEPTTRLAQLATDGPLVLHCQ